MLKTETILRLEPNKNDIINMYNDNISVEIIARKYGTHHKTVRNIVKMWGVKERERISNKGLLEGKDKEIVSMYNNGKNCAEISQNFGVTRTAILYWGKKNGLNFSHIPNTIKKYSANENFFERIDTEEKAYLLGLYYSDGTICNNRVILGMNDIDIIEKTQKCLNYIGPLYTKKQKKSVLNILDISSIKMVADLKDKGCTERKSLVIKFPTKKQLPDYLIKHFLRGLFDGDGCIYFHKSSGHYYVDITGTKEICDGCQLHLNIGHIRRCRNNDKNTFRWTIYDKNHVNKFLHYIYDNHTISMDRKRLKAYQCLECYNAPNNSI